MAEGKWIEGLSAGMPAIEAARLVLAARYDAVRKALPLAVQESDQDIEHVHQLRVTSRRAAAALRTFASYLPRKRLNAAKNALRLIRQAAGHARDWDVFLASLSDRAESAVALSRPTVDFLSGYGLRERTEAQSQLEDAAHEVRSFFRRDSVALTRRIREPKGVPRSLGEHAAFLLSAEFRRFQQAASASVETAHDRHALRIAAKKLRYTVELFVDCFAPPLRDVVYPAIERAQELLGDLQDFAVSTARISDIRSQYRRMKPHERARLEPGFDQLIAELGEREKTAIEKFRNWRSDWATIVVEHPLESLRLTAIESAEASHSS